MPNKKNNQMNESGSSMNKSSDREFESQSSRSGMGGQSGQKSGSTSNRGMGSGSDMEDDEMETAGGRQGNFSDKNRGSEQWSPGSSGGPSDQ